MGITMDIYQPSQPQMCVCCGKQYAVPPELGDRVNRRTRLRITDEIRQQVPEEVLRHMEEAHRNRPPLRAGFCSMCNRAGCDGVSPCKVPDETWARMNEHRAIEAAWEKARGAGPIEWFNPNDEHRIARIMASAPKEWTEVSEGYWQRLVDAPVGVVLCEALRNDALNEYHAEVTVIQVADPAKQGQLHGRGRLDAQSLEEALADCDRMIAEVAEEMENDEVFIHNYSIPLEPDEEGEK